jgi:AraC family transcriptional regulator
MTSGISEPSSGGSIRLDFRRTDMPLASGAATYHREAVERVICEMYDHFEEPISLKDMAELARFSPYHFHRLFTNMTGLPPARFLAAVRIEAAKRLLVTEDFSVTRICMSVGYSSLGAFSTRFHQAVGVSPSCLRRLARDEEFPSTVATAASAGGHGHSPGAPPSVEGTVHGDCAPAVTIFIGLFGTRSPECVPEACTILSGPGAFSLPAVPDGDYHVLAASLRNSKHALSLLVPNRSNVLVASMPDSLKLRGSTAPVELHLRPVTLTDPPMLTALPALLATTHGVPVGTSVPRQAIA